jgi:acylphosphatase
MGESQDRARVQITITGRVQGVYFRASALAEAQALGLTGWVMNCNDGSVMALAEGPTDMLNRLIAWCRQGPRGARVTDVDVRWEKPQDEFTRFDIRR